MIRDLRNLRLWGGVRRGGEAACAVRAFKTTTNSQLYRHRLMDYCRYSYLIRDSYLWCFNTDHSGYSCSTHRLTVGRAGAAGSQNGAFAISLLAVAALHPSALLDFVAAWAD